MVKKQEKIETEGLPQNKYDIRAIGRKCCICQEVFNKEKIDKKVNKMGLKNIPVKMPNIPGYLHKRCRGEMGASLINSSFDHENLEYLL